VPGRRDTLLRLAPELGMSNFMEPSPDGRALVSLGWNVTEDSISLFRLSMTDGAVTRLARFAGEGTQQPIWLNDGTILVPILETSWTLAWYRIPAAGGIPVRLGSPPRFPADYRISRDGRRGIARVSDARSDVYVIRNFSELLAASTRD
jgi:hypothetical protein